MITPVSALVRTDDEARAVYSEAAGIARVLPLGVAVPSSVEEVRRIVRWAGETGTPLVPRGSGTSMAGGAVGSGVVVDLSRMNHVGAVDVAGKRVLVGPGALRGDVERAARAVGLRFPPDPSSGAYCTIGGMVSTNAAGAHTLKYGQTRSWVSALECVFDDGSHAVVRRGATDTTNTIPTDGAPHGHDDAAILDIPAIRRLLAITGRLVAADAASPAVHPGVRKESSGYNVHAYARSRDPVDLLVGSEGTLAIIVGVELRLTDAPGATSSILGAFATLEEAVTAATRARNVGAAACELLDRTFLEVAARGASLPHVPDGTEAVLLAEVEGESADEASHAAEALGSTFTAAGATTVILALTPPDEQSLWELRHAASPRLASLGPSLQSMQFIEDSAVPPEALPAYVRGVRRIFRDYQVPGVIFGHAGDAHVHVNPLIDTNRTEWRDTVRNMLLDVVSLTADLGGTLSGEHGDGRLRTPLLQHLWPVEVMEMFRMVKGAFDPAGIFNPGVKVPLEGQFPITDIKYDPSIPPLQPRAAAALARVARERAYARFRLDLLNEAS